MDKDKCMCNKNAAQLALAKMCLDCEFYYQCDLPCENYKTLDAFVEFSSKMIDICKKHGIDSLEKLEETLDKCCSSK